MTALDKFVRLESGGLWRESKDADPREVTVSFGKTTLVLSDGAGPPIAHWSLPAVQRRNAGQRPAVFSPDDDATETLEVEDPLMIDAIEQVRKALLAPQAHPGRLRGILALGVLAAIVVGAAVWAPPALTQKTLSVVHQAKRSEIGDALAGHYQRLTGTACNSPAGTVALRKLHNRLIGTGTAGKITVVQDLPQGAAALPGGRILVDRRILETHDDPAVLSGYILAAVTDRQANDPLERLLDHAGVQTTLSLLATGEVSETVLQGYANAVQNADQPQVSPADLRAVFDAALVPGDAYVRAANAPPEVLAAFEGMPSTTDRPLIKDSDWVRLQGICRA